ncbi:MAG: hypothetical protein IT423_03170 [Pirellulaceae bacterium]|nr:hypothetical protein [Pirellulaceae bacterium]
MKLTEKDKQFLETLKSLMDSKDLWVELRPGRPSTLVLKGTYGEKVHQSFRMSRQGVRWRFHRAFSEMYVSAFETILFIEKAFGTQLREHAIRISKERYTERQKWRENGLQSADSLDSRRQTKEPAPSGRGSEL